jgi:ADP-ribose pyrophosphatase
MDPLKRYFALVQERPEFFRNTGEPGEIKIILDPERILAEQQRIQAELRAQGKPEHWIDIGVLTEDEWFWTIRDMVEFPDGHIWGYVRDINRKSQEGGGYNVVLMCVQGDQVLMIRKFRHEKRNWSWEFPRGFGEPGLSAEENARKELSEEIGVEPTKLKLLTEVKEEKGGTCVYYAELWLDKQIKLDEREGLGKFRWVTFAELDELVKQGQLSDWFSLWAYALFKSKI